MIELVQVVKKFGTFTAVDHVSLTIGEGQFFGFLGPNGAGKTTTIKMMTGQLRPTSGTCRIGGFDVRENTTEAKRNFGYVPDQPYLYDRLTGREFLLFVGGLFSISHLILRRKVEELTELFETGDFLDKRAEEYSQGMRQRVALSAALLHEPRVLIIDEPLIGLDPRSARILKDTLKRKTREGMTVFMSTHLLEIVEELCDRIAIIKEGRIIYEAAQSGGKPLDGQLEATFLALTR